MRTFLLLILTGFFAINVSGQVSFSSVDSKLKTQKVNDLTELICTSPTISIEFQLKHNVVITQHKNFVTVDSQVIQIIPLKYSNNKTDSFEQNINYQKQLLDAYSKYEIDYFKNELGVTVINLNSQWVVTKSKGWFIWYFKVGNIPEQVYKKTRIQLFASTFIGDNILIINAPIFTDGDFTKAGLIVNDMMETLTILKQ